MRGKSICSQTPSVFLKLLQFFSGSLIWLDPVVEFPKTRPQTSLFQPYSIYFNKGSLIASSLFTNEILRDCMLGSIYDLVSLFRKCPRVKLFLLKLLIEGFHLFLFYHQPLTELECGKFFWDTFVQMVKFDTLKHI